MHITDVAIELELGPITMCTAIIRDVWMIWRVRRLNSSPAFRTLPLERPCELIYDSMTSVTSCGYHSRTAICGQPINLAA